MQDTQRAICRIPPAGGDGVPYFLLPVVLPACLPPAWPSLVEQTAAAARAFRSPVIHTSTRRCVATAPTTAAPVKKHGAWTGQTIQAEANVLPATVPGGLVYWHTAPQNQTFSCIWPRPAPHKPAGRFPHISPAAASNSPPSPATLVPHGWRPKHPQPPGPLAVMPGAFGAHTVRRGGSPSQPASHCQQSRCARGTTSHGRHPRPLPPRCPAARSTTPLTLKEAWT